MKHWNLKRVLSLLLVVCMVTGLLSGVSAMAEDQTANYHEISTDGLKLATEDNAAADETETEEAPYADTDVVRVFVVLEDKPVLQQGYATRGIAGNAAAMAVSKALEAKQAALAAEISANVLSGETLNVHWNLTLAANAMSVDLPYGKMDEVEALKGVKSVMLVPQYSIDPREQADLNTISSGNMIGSYNAWLEGYTGAGSRIAIVDTGLDSDHPSFNSAAFDYSLLVTSTKNGKQIADYNLLTAAKINEVLPQLHAAERYEGLTGNALYVSSKIAFGFNYIDATLDITHDNDQQGDHGTHVAGIATANRYVENADGTYTEIEQPQAAACVFDYRTGELKAIVGGRYKPTTRKTLNRASGMTMPVGSSIKPLTVYAPAIDLGASPASIAYNMPVPISGWKDSSGKDSWPKNYGGGGYKGPQSFRSALRNSYNTAAAQILMTYVGVSRSVEYLHLMGIPDKNINADPFGLALGSSGITPVQMAVAFGTIANKGVYQQPLSFSRIVDSNGNVVVDMHQQQDRHQVFKPSTAYLVVDMLKEAVQSGTGTKAKISSQVVAGKTGTNSDSKGVFFAGMTGWYSASVWIGHDNYKALSSKATGGNAAAPLWQSFMEKIHKAKNLDSREIIDGTPSDYNLVRVTTCGVSGQLATDACYNDVNGYKTITDYWSADSVPTAYCSMHKSVSICTESGLLATDYCPSYSVESRGIVLIPRGHPLYDYIDTYGDTIRKYLGEFATLKSTNDIANHICQIHDAYTATQQPSELESIVSDASSLVYTAYQLVGSSPDLTNDTRRQINTAISAVQTLLSLSPIDYTSLEGAVSNLRSQLQAAGLM